MSNSYASQANSHLAKNSAGHYVAIGKRYLTSVTNPDGTTIVYRQSRINSALQDFKNKHAKTKLWKELSFCSAQTTTMDKIIIDTTLQRLLDVMHTSDIIKNFTSIRVMPISVYEDADKPGYYICWDGQHTVVALYLIATEIFKMKLSDITVPIVIYSSKMKSEMRQNFIELNGDSKKPLDEIDKFHQYVHGVRTDGAKVEDWVLCEKKQTLLENAQMFVTHEKFGDTDKAGAYTRLTELMEKDYDLVVTQNFCEYFATLNGSNRPVQPKESWIMYDFFRLCHLNKIPVDSKFIAEICNCIKLQFGGDMESLELLSRAKASYRESYRKLRITVDNPEGDCLGIQYPENKLALTYLFALIKKHYKGPLPKYNALWSVDKSELL